MFGSWYYAIVQYFYKRGRAKRLAAAAERRHQAKMKFTCTDTKTCKLTLTRDYGDDIVYTMVVGYLVNGYGHRKASVITCNYPKEYQRVVEQQMADVNAWAARGTQSIG